MAEPVIQSVREELEGLGVKYPQTSGTSSSLGQTIRDYLLGPKDPQTRAQRLADFKAAENEFFGKQARRKLDPDKVGTVLHIKPLQPGDFRSPIKSDKKGYNPSHFEAYIRWSKSKGTYQRLDQIELVNS